MEVGQEGYFSPNYGYSGSTSFGFQRRSKQVTLDMKNFYLSRVTELIGCRQMPDLEIRLRAKFQGSNCSDRKFKKSLRWSCLCIPII